MPPEYVKTRNYTPKGDIYSFGCLAMGASLDFVAVPSTGFDGISELVTDEKPHSRLETIGNVARARRRGEPPYSSEWFMSSEPILEVARACLEPEPEKRPSARAIIHAWDKTQTACQYSLTDNKVQHVDSPTKELNETPGVRASGQGTFPRTLVETEILCPNGYSGSSDGSVDYWKILTNACKGKVQYWFARPGFRQALLWNATIKCK